MQLGVLSCGDGLDDPAERQRAIVEQAVLAETLGFDSMWLGEQDGRDGVLASPQVLLAAIAARTSRVRLGTGVTLVANLDPVRVAEDYATIDAISDGRVELVASHCDAPESRERHREHLELLLRLWRETDVTWHGRFRAPLDAITLEPRPVQRPHPPVWAGGSSLHAVDLAAELGLPLMLPNALAPALDFAPLVDRYRQRFAAAGHDPAAARVGCSQPVHLRDGSRDARLTGVAICGTSAEVVDHVGATCEMLGIDVHLAIFDLGGLPPADVARTMELYAAAVAPQLRGLGQRPA